jgi:pimeloyl-ACP methyl ester carboxylesterase
MKASWRRLTARHSSPKIMHLERYGSGSRVYFGLHGWSGDHTTFAPLLLYLPDDASLYVADLPGCGQSPAPAAWALPAIADEIAEAVSRLAAPTLTLIGNCSGALLGLVAAKRIASKFERLVLIDPFAYWPWYFKVFVAPSFGRYAYFSTFANPVGRWLANRSLKSKRAGQSHLTQSFAEVNHEAVYRYLLLLTGIDGVEQFSELRMPIDIVYGARTFVAVKKSLEIWRAIWPQARCRELPGAGHLPIEEATEQLSEIIFSLASEPETPAVHSSMRGASRQ